MYFKLLFLWGNGARPLNTRVKIRRNSIQIWTKYSLITSVQHYRSVNLFHVCNCPGWLRFKDTSLVWWRAAWFSSFGKSRTQSGLWASWLPVLVVCEVLHTAVSWGQRTRFEKMWSGGICNAARWEPHAGHFGLSNSFRQSWTIFYSNLLFRLRTTATVYAISGYCTESFSFRTQIQAKKSDARTVKSVPPPNA